MFRREQASSPLWRHSGEDVAEHRDSLREPVMSQAKSPTALSIATRACVPALGATFVLSLFINASMLVSPIYSMQIYDRVLSSRNIGTLVMLTLIVFAFLALYGLLEYARAGVLVRASVDFDEILREPLFETLMRAQLSPRHRFGQQMIRDADLFRESVAGGVATTLCDLPWTPIYIGMCFMLHPLLGSVALIGGVSLFLLAWASDLFTKRSVLEASRLSIEAQGMAASTLRNGEIVFGLGMGDSLRGRWADLQAAANAEAASGHETSATINAVSKFARVAVQTALLFCGAWLAVDGEISPGAMLAASIVMGRALAPVEMVVGNWKRIIGCRAAYQRLQALFEAFPDSAAALELPRPKGKLEVNSVVIWPPFAVKPSVKYLSLSLEAGESLAVVGASGSGKSSLLRALAGVWAPGDGVIRIDDADYAQWDKQRLGRHIGYVPQTIELFAGTVAENIARMGEVDEQKVFAAAQLAGAHDAILRLPLGYNTQLGDGGVGLAGGMRQRIALARALFGDPSLVLLDEPDSNLDEEGEKALGEALSSLKNSGKTFIIVTHRPAVLSMVDKLLVMSFGQALAFGKRNEVLAKVRGNRVAVVADAGAQS
jgi:ATP-binding cassette subfamily C protein/ATP-binding cassette subfamily C protein EexD